MRFLLIIILLLLNGCSTATFRSNSDVFVKNKIENSIRRSAIDRYTNYEVWKLGGSQVGYVESNYCQVDFRDINPSREALISELEVKTQKLGGNALVFDSCLVHKSTASCHTYTQCKGMAYLITYKK